MTAERLFELYGDVAVRTVAAAPITTAGPATADPGFAARVASLLRSLPIAEAAAVAARQDWPAGGYDVVSLALALIDLVIGQQGFDTECSYQQAVDALAGLARRSAPQRPAAEHRRVAVVTIDALLNRGRREAPFTYRISDWSGPAGHRYRQVQFRLLTEHEDGRGDVVLRATRDAINALVGGLEFDVEDEQVANETLLERQLARGAFDAAERAAVRARLLSVRLADDLQRLVAETRRDLRSVVDTWQHRVPRALDVAREHIGARVEAEHRLLARLTETLESGTGDPDGAAEDEVRAIAARIGALLTECRQRHEALHTQVITARSTFLDEQARQAFRPPATGHVPDLTTEVLRPFLALPRADAEPVGRRLLHDVAGPRARRLPRLYRLVGDLWAAPAVQEEPVGPPAPDEVGEPDPPGLDPRAVSRAERAVSAVGLPARLSTLLVACLQGPDPDPGADPEPVRRLAAHLVSLAVLARFALEDPEPAGPAGGAAGALPHDLVERLLGPGAAADTDGTPLELPGWHGDDLVVVAQVDQLLAELPAPARIDDLVGAR